MDVSGPLSHNVLQLLADGIKYTEIGLIEKDITWQQRNVAFFLSSAIENFNKHKEEYLIEHVASFHGKIKPIDPGNLSKTVKNLWGLRFICHKLVIKKGKEYHLYYLQWPDSYYIILNYAKHLEKRYAREMDGLNLADPKQLKTYKNIDKKRDLCRQTVAIFNFWIEEFERKQKMELEAAFLNEHYPIAEPWSPDLSKFKKLVTSIKPLCKIPDKNSGPEDAFADVIVYRLRPGLLEAHFKWLEENPLPATCDDRRIRYDGYSYWYHLSDAPFQPSQKGHFEADGMK